VNNSGNAVDINHSVSSLAGVGPRIEELLKKIGIETIQDLLFHLPSRYQDRTRITPIARIREGDYALIEGEILTATVNGGPRATLLCQLNDDSGNIYLRFFHFTAAQKQQLIPGARLRCFGEARRAFRHYGLEIIHPEYRQIREAHELPLDQNLTPIYPATQGLSQPLLRRLINQALQNLANATQSCELLPATLLAQFQLSDLESALIYVHRPPPQADVDLLLQGKHAMQQRLAFEELIAYQLTLQKSRRQVRMQTAMKLPGADNLRRDFLNGVGFELTAAQRRVIAEIDQDLLQPNPMLRLLQGDVGSGKTVVAAMAMLQAVANRTQTVLTAPTELLAEQHFQNFSRWFTPLNIEVGYLGGKQPQSVRRKLLEKIAGGEIPVVIGTHAVFQETVHYSQLTLLVIDEQHRFGVSQRLALREKGSSNSCFPHQLIMSATPIPRTLAMAAYADLDISVIDELPPGRKPVVTALVPNHRRQQVIERVRVACRQGKQVYWVCTLIEDSEVLQCQAAEATARELQKSLSELTLGLVHSRLSPEEKTTQMQAFKHGSIDLLVATTVIEVGVDVPNASLMIIENPERLGLSQLHQLRGRVGRGSAESFCVLLFQEPLSVLAQQRLQVMRNTCDGFVIAREDLAIRGPGEVLGTRQSGAAKLKMADLLRDEQLLPQARAASEYLLEHVPDRAAALISRWLHREQKYVQV
jgi:ATP-dependent DNA helicase RecG